MCFRMSSIFTNIDARGTIVTANIGLVLTSAVPSLPQRKHQLRESGGLFFPKALLRDYFRGPHTPELSTAP